VVEVELQQLEELSMIKALLSPQPLIECWWHFPILVQPDAGFLIFFQSLRSTASS
jgi:hypothetical protein